ncbi:hypothetical protein AKJ40_01960 [candidate division MSBL1 archaeon SCGC-AAA259M10]|uniref:DUF7210 domain-containing protein n=3 Tax=candidate division MSBL1 TaxID=215777 RepID=A0A133U7N3_9EURY|nr:hypothetical protein AKJ62_01510 [candidate division MSBL1 archaeon SCGC-AAA259D14]KXA93717.1 hypothetical protein AKJ66_01210 [candidate division MSBL1 archaeon SCGC-AAA259E22]KXB00064.1 hypothetical protein AKJ40_01960 [candidate division MSBL1 archaeon SCGC-AAA259M10]
MRILVEKNFEHEGETYEPGETVDLPEEVAERAIEKGAAKKVEDIEDEIEITPGGEVEPSEEEGFPEEVSMPAEEGRSEEDESDVWEELESELEEPSRSPAWRPEEVGDQLLGEVTRTGRGPNGRLLEVRTPEGEKYVLWEKVALKDLFDRVQAGDKIGVRFLGEEESSSGRSYYNYRTALKKGDRN